MATINGSDLMIFVGGESLAFATNHSLTINSETNDTTSKDTGGLWTSASLKKLNWEISADCLFATTGEGSTMDELFSSMITGTPVTVVFTTKTGTATTVPTGGWTAATTNKFSGSALITSLTLNAPNGEDATYSVTLTGTGALAWTGSTSSGN